MSEGDAGVMLSPSSSRLTPELLGRERSPKSQVSHQEMLRSPSKPALPAPTGSSRQRDGAASLNTGQKS